PHFRSIRRKRKSVSTSWSSFGIMLRPTGRSSCASIRRCDPGAAPCHPHGAARFCAGTQIAVVFPCMKPPNGRPDSEELSLLVDAVQDYAIFLLGPYGAIRSWNLGASRIMGYEAREAVGKHFSIFYPADDIAARKPERELEVAASERRIEDEGW